MIAYSPRAGIALAFLKRPYNDVDIFVEDTACRNMWLAIIKSILPEHIRLRSLNQLGGRKKVVEACKHDQVDPSRRKLYIIDADFDTVQQKSTPRLRNLYRLRAYCVESLLIKESFALHVAGALSPNMNEAQLAARLGFDGWLERERGILTPLFIVYATAMKICPEIKTVSFQVHHLVQNTNKGAKLDRARVRKRIFEVAREICARCGLRAMSATRREVSRVVAGLAHHQIISGKDYLFPLLYIRMQKIFGFHGRPEELKVHLARCWRPETEPALTKRLRALTK